MQTRNRSILTVIGLVFFLTAGTALATTDTKISEAQKSRIQAKMAAMQIPFIENQGQMDDAVALYANTFGGTLTDLHIV